MSSNRADQDSYRSDSHFEDVHYTSHEENGLEEDYYENSQQLQAHDEDYNNDNDNDGMERDEKNYDQYDNEEDDYYDDDGNYQNRRPVAPYSDQPYIPSNDTGEGMMVYDETIEDDPEYDYDPEEEDEDGERAPMMMPDDYYGDEPDDGEEYYDEDEDERRRRRRRRRAWCCCLMLLCCLLIVIILLLIFLLRGRGDEEEKTPAPTFAPFVDETDDDFYYDDDIILAPGVITSYMAPMDDNCDFDDQEGFAHVVDQCNCDGAITSVPDDVLQMRQLLIDRMANKFYEEGDVINWKSCEPRNLALIWLASGNNRDSGEPRQRFALALSYFQLNGTIWDYDDEWLGELNECLWLGVQCNNRDSVNSFSLDTNNVFGLVRWFLRDFFLS